MKNITQEEWKSLVAEDKSAIIIDSRRPDEWEMGIIENALMINIMDAVDFNEKAVKLDPSKNYYVYCRSGVRSITACNILENMGFKTTYNLLGGIIGWTGKTIIPKR